MNIGLTGSIATGKSTVASLLVDRGAILIDADRIAREVVLPGSPVLTQVADRFGQAVLLGDGSLDRKKLGEFIFGDAASRKDLEGILHPPIRAIMKERMQRHELEYPEKLVVVDVPLLFESKLQHMFTEIMVVYVPAAIQLERLIHRDQLTEEKAISRLNSQMSIEEKKKLADIVIDNSGTIQETEQQVTQFWRRKGL
jgi:dephospho-CoA kinase